MMVAQTPPAAAEIRRNEGVFPDKWVELPPQRVFHFLREGIVEASSHVSAGTNGKKLHRVKMREIS